MIKKALKKIIKQNCLWMNGDFTKILKKHQMSFYKKPGKITTSFIFLMILLIVFFY